MPVTWEVRPRLVIVTVTGDYRRADVDAAIEAALAAPAFQRGSALLFDVSAALTYVSPADVTVRIASTVALAARGLDDKIAVVASDAPEQYYRVRASEEFIRGVQAHGRQAQLFMSRAAAEQWLGAPGPNTSAPSRLEDRTFQLLFESNPLPMWVFDAATAYFLEVNRAATTHYGYSREEFLRMRVTDIRPPEDVPRLQQIISEHVAEQRPMVHRYETPFRHRLKDGRIRQVDVVSQAIDFAGRRAILAVMTDVTELKDVQASLAESRQRLAILHEIDRAIIAADAPDTIARAAVGRLRELLGVPRVILNVFDLVAGEAEWLAAAGRHRVHSGPSIRFPLAWMGDIEALRRGEIQILDTATLRRTPDAAAMLASWVGIYIVVPMIASGELIGALCFGGESDARDPDHVAIATDVAAQLAIAIAQARLRERALAAERYYREIFENAVDGMYRSTAAGRYLVVNAAMARIFGYASPADMVTSVIDIGQELYVDPPQRETLLQRLREHGVVSAFEWQAKRADGTVIWVSQSARQVRDEKDDILYIEGVIEDITDRKRFEEEVRHAQRMEGVGQLAGGIAHDFNNLLTVISGRSQLAVDRLPPEHPVRRDLDLMYKTAARAAALTRQLLAFSRKQVLQPRVVDVNALIDDATKLLTRLIGEHVELTFVPSPEAPRVRVDPGQLEQVIFNVAVNARDAMPNGGRLTIEVTTVVLDAAYAAGHADVTTGPHVMLAVTDTGEGMSPQVRARIFEPFFTTKGVGKGTGLGLATVYGIVKQSGGHIRVYSELGMGTTFRIYLPRTDAPREAIAVAPTSTLPQGTETVLLIEDEVEVRALARQILEHLGYTVLEAAHPTDALAIARHHVGLIDVVLTDVVMPTMSGRAVAQAISAERPEAKIVFMSGYTDDAIVRHGVLEPGTDFIEKPFTPHALAVKIRAVADRGP